VTSQEGLSFMKFVIYIQNHSGSIHNKITLAGNGFHWESWKSRTFAVHDKMLRYPHHCLRNADVVCSRTRNLKHSSKNISGLQFVNIDSTLNISVDVPCVCKSVLHSL
jgi:hypothetical protein